MQPSQDIYDIPTSLRSGYPSQDVYDFPRERTERPAERGEQNVYDVPPQVRADIEQHRAVTDSCNNLLCTDFSSKI